MVWHRLQRNGVFITTVSFSTRRPNALNRLNRDHLEHLNERVKIPQYRLTTDDCGILHLGLGQFSRGHLLDYLDELLGSNPGPWGLIGVSLRSDGAAALAEQDGLYTLIHQSEVSVSAKVVGALKGVIVLDSEDGPNQLQGYLLSPKVRIISLTITEKGYYLTSEGRLNVAHPDIAADLEQPYQPRTALGWIALGLKLRLERGIVLFTVMSLDNLAGNGRVLRQVVLDYIGVAFPEIKSVVRDQASFPSSMVDRIVPAQNLADRALAQKILGVRDQSVVVTEPFCQWVLEDRFVSGRPDWGSVGVTLCADVAPFEAMKLRLLNGAHSAIAYVGLMLGYDSVADCLADPIVADYVSRLMVDEILPGVVAPPSVDLPGYVMTLLARFKNPFLHHRCQQIAMDGSEKIQQRWLPVLASRLETQSPVPLMAFGLASWMIYLEGPSVVQDPRRDQLQRLLVDQSRRAQAAALIQDSGMFLGVTSHSRRLIGQVAASLESIDAHGGSQALSQLLRDQQRGDAS